MYWPSFNSAETTGVTQQRAVVNTVLAITTSGLVASFVASIFHGKFVMEVLMHATLAGGVAIGTSCSLWTSAVYPLAIGAVSGAISALGYLKMNKFLQANLKMHDTCGVHFKHGIPGLLGGCFGAAATLLADQLF